VGVVCDSPVWAVDDETKTISVISKRADQCSSRFQSCKIRPTVEFPYQAHRYLFGYARANFRVADLSAKIACPHSQSSSEHGQRQHYEH
jgi:hypothetical protein